MHRDPPCYLGSWAIKVNHSESNPEQLIVSACRPHANGVTHTNEGQRPGNQNESDRRTLSGCLIRDPNLSH